MVPLADLRKRKQPFYRKLLCRIGIHKYCWLHAWTYNPKGKDFRTRACICCPKMYETQKWGF